MKKHIHTFLFVCSILIGLFIAVFAFKQNNPVNESNTKQQLLVSILPQKQIVERIVGDTNYAVDVLIPPGFSPETYDPTTQEMQKVSQAKMYFRIGKIPFEMVHIKKLIEVNPNMIVVDTSINNTFRNLEEHTHGVEDLHEGEEIHTEEAEIDPHTWLSPKMVKEQAEVIYTELVKKYPEHADTFSANFAQLQKDLDTLDQELSLAFAHIEGKTMLVYHPAFGYLARDYNFNQEHIQIEGKDPSIADLRDILTEAKNDGVRVIFVQKQFSKDSAQAIADHINGVVVEVDPLDPDYFTNMRTIAHIISDNLK